MENKLMKRHSTSLIMKMQIKTIMTYYHTPIRTAVSHVVPKPGKDAEQCTVPCIAGGKVK